MPPVNFLTPFLNEMPQWLSITIFLSFIVTLVGLKLANMMYEGSKGYRTYLKRLHQLELIKLHYEIETFKKDPDLADPPEDLITNLMQYQEQARIQMSNQKESIPFKKIIFFGALLPVIFAVFFPVLVEDLDLYLQSEFWTMFAILGASGAISSIFFQSVFPIKTIGKSLLFGVFGGVPLGMALFLSQL